MFIFVLMKNDTFIKLLSFIPVAAALNGLPEYVKGIYFVTLKRTIIPC